jgi:hypothetical protein
MLRLTVPVKPFKGVTVVVYLALEPRLIVWLEGVAEMEKLGVATTVSVTVVLCWMPPPLPVTVMG